MQVVLGGFFERGVGMVADPVQALDWYRRAAATGNDFAKLRLYNFYERFAPSDPVQAVAWYRRAAEAGDVGMQLKLGDCYERGVGVAADHVQALAWYHRASEAQSVYAQLKLADYYERSVGESANNVHAVDWYHRAAEALAGPDAELKLASCFEGSMRTLALRALAYRKKRKDLEAPILLQCSVDASQFLLASGFSPQDVASVAAVLSQSTIEERRARYLASQPGLSPVGSGRQLPVVAGHGGCQ